MGKIEIYKSEKERPDQTWYLGKNLTSSEERCYRIIYLSGTIPISTEDISKKLLDNPENFDFITSVNKRNVWNIITRIRKKLGSEEIICRPGYGYISRRMMINEMVEKNLKKNG